MPYVTMRDQAHLYVRTLGRGQPVLMLPGLGMSSRHWLPFVLPFAHRFRFVLPDFRGHGASRAARLNQADVFQNHMEDTQDVIAHFGLQDFLLGGISMGCSTALHLRQAAGWSDVRAYLHIDQSPCVVNQADWPYGLAGEQQGELFGLMHQVLGLLDEAALPTYFDQLTQTRQVAIAVKLAKVLELLGSGRRNVVLVRHLPRLPGALQRRLPLMRLEDMQAYLRAYSGGGHDYRASLGADDVPVTLMFGAQSRLYPEAGQMLIAERAHRAQVVPFTRSGHVPLVSEPLKFVRELGRFLREHGAVQRVSDPV